MTQDELLRLIDEAAVDRRPTLDLAGEGLSKLPPEIGKLTNLKTLILGRFVKNKFKRLGNKLSALPDEIVELQELHTIFLYDNHFFELPEVILELKKLRTVSLCSNNLRGLSAHVEQLTNMRFLDVSHNQLTNLPENIGKLSNLRSLQLSFNQLKTLPESIGELTKLRMIDISDNQVSALPRNIGQIDNLKTLNCHYNRLEELPQSIERLTRLQFLDLSFNRFKTYPNVLCQLTGLQSLDLHDNQLKAISENIDQLQNLKFLDLRANELCNLPESIWELKSLMFLDLFATELSDLSENVSQLANLQSLNLQGSQFTELPESLGQLRKLRSLNLSETKLSRLPHSIGQLKNLQEMSLHYSELEELPESIGHLTKLRWLDLSCNNLKRLPNTIGQLLNLRSLDLSDNQLGSLPASAVALKTIEYLDLRRNQLPIPPEILGSKEHQSEPSPANRTLGFYFSLKLEKGSIPLYEAKLILVGEGGAGKTSLAKKINNADYPLPKDEKTTEGIDVIRWEFLLANGNTFRVNIWDFGGQEIYHATHQFFLTKRSLYLLVADDRRENTDFYYWLKIVELLSDNSPVLIIKNEKQDRQCEIDEGLFKSQFSGLKDYYPTNLEDNRGLEKIKAAIQFHISQLPHIGNPLPKNWVRVRSALENYAQNCNTITLDTYFDICRQNGFTDKAKMLSLSSYLHDLGVCLHFQDDKLLKRTVILRPEWATTAVYKVADSDTVRKNKGRFTEADAAKIWSDSDYSDLCDELLQLMMRFKLAYELPNKPGYYIAPQLLPINRPQYDWDTNDNLVLRYHYDFMPKGILTRFIVETHPLIEHQDRVWKNGVVLKDNWAQAEITENYPKNEINVKVSGSNKKPLLEKVRYELWKIHQSYERLQYQELIPCNCTKCKTNSDPERYDYTLLAQFITDKNYSIQCRKSYQSIDVRHLMSDILSESYATPKEKHFRETEIDGEMAAFQQQRALAYGPTYIDQSRTTNVTLQEATGSQLIVGDDNTLSKTNSPSNSTLPPDTASLAQDLKALLEDFSEDFRPDTERGQTKIKDAVITELKQKPTLKARTTKALKAAGEQTLIEAVNHPVAKVVIKGIKGFLEG